MKSSSPSKHSFKEYEEEKKNNKIPEKPSSQVRSYCFTLNNYTEEEYENILQQLSKYDYAVVGKEVGDEGTPHLQGFVYHENKIRFSTLKALMPRAHIEVTGAKGKKMCKAWEYCMKEGDYWEKGTKPSQGKRTDLHDYMDTVDSGVYDEFELMKKHPMVTAKYEGWCHKYKNFTRIENELVPPNIELREWQKVVKEMLEGDIIDRRIIWIWSEASLTGKSTYMKWLHATWKRAMMSTDELRKKDVLYAYNDHRIVHIDLARDQTDDQRKYLKSTLEALSDAKLQLSSKYQSSEKLVRCHVIVTANQPPIDGLPYRYHEFKVNANENYVYTDWQQLCESSDGSKYFKSQEYKVQAGSSSPPQLFMKRVALKDAKYMECAPVINNRFS